MPVVGAPSTTTQLILDPVTEDATNVELELTDDNNYGLLAHTYPAPNVAAQWASSVSTEGSVLASQRHENRTITISVEVNGLGALQDLEAKIGKLYREGGTLKRVYSDGREIVFDVLTVTGFDPSFEQLHHFADVTPVSITLECKPYGRGADEELLPHSETTLPVLVFTETGIKGDMDAEAVITITEAQAQDQKFLVWGVQSRDFDASDVTADNSLFREAESMTIDSLANTGPRAGASGGSIAKRSAGSGTVINETGITLVGTYRIFLRVYGPIDVRWTVTVTSESTSSSDSTTTTAGAFQLLDAGQFRFDRARLGTQSATLTIDSSTVGGELDYVMFVPVDENSGQAYSSTTTVLPASAKARIDSGSALRQLTSTTTWPRLPGFEGDHFRIPVAGLEQRSLRVIVKASRDPAADAGIDDLTAQITYTPRYLVVPAA